MPFQQKLIQANEAGEWNSSQNKITISIPTADAVCDFSNSDLVLDIAVQANGANLGLFDVQFNNKYDPRALIRTVRLVTNKGGIVEEIQNSNVLTQNLARFNKNQATALSRTWLQDGQSPAPQVGSLLTKYNVGSQLSTQNSYVPIPLKGILGVGGARQWLNGAYDGTSIEIYLDYNSSVISRLFEQVTVSAQDCDQIAIGGAADVALEWQANNQTAIPYYVGQPVTVISDPVFVAMKATACPRANPTVITLPYTPTEMSIAVNDTVTISNIAGGGWAGLLNGDKVVTAIDDANKTITIAVDSSSEGADPTTLPDIVRQVAEQPSGLEQNRVISSIAITSDNEVTITVNSSVGWVPYEAENVKIKGQISGVNNTALSYVVNDAQLRLTQWTLTGNQASKMSGLSTKQLSIPFVSWIVERVNMPTVSADSKYVDLIELHPNCRQVMIMVPDPAGSNPLLSLQDNQQNYRFSLDTIYTTSRAIVPHDALYYDRLIQGLVNSQQAINNYVGATNPVIWCQDVPVDGRSHQLQYEFNQNSNAGTANKVMYVFQCINKVIKSGKGGMMVM